MSKWALNSGPKVKVAMVCSTNHSPYVFVCSSRVDTVCGIALGARRPAPTAGTAGGDAEGVVARLEGEQQQAKCLVVQHCLSSSLVSAHSKNVCERPLCLEM